MCIFTMELNKDDWTNVKTSAESSIKDHMLGLIQAKHMLKCAISGLNKFPTVKEPTEEEEREAFKKEQNIVNDKQII